MNIFKQFVCLLSYTLLSINALTASSTTNNYTINCYASSGSNVSCENLGISGDQLNTAGADQISWNTARMNDHSLGIANTPITFNLDFDLASHASLYTYRATQGILKDKTIRFLLIYFSTEQDKEATEIPKKIMQKARREIKSLGSNVKHVLKVYRQIEGERTYTEVAQIASNSATLAEFTKEIHQTSVTLQPNNTINFSIRQGGKLVPVVIDLGVMV